MNEQEFRRRFPHASRAVVQLNTGAAVSAAELKPAAAAPLDDRFPREASRHPRVKLSYRARVVRPLDADNLAGSTKYITDALVRSGLLHGDSPEALTIEWSQEKVGHYEEEQLILTISEFA